MTLGTPITKLLVDTLTLFTTSLQPNLSPSLGFLWQSQSYVLSPFKINEIRSNMDWSCIITKEIQNPIHSTGFLITTTHMCHMLLYNMKDPSEWVYYGCKSMVMSDLQSQVSCECLRFWNTLIQITKTLNRTTVRFSTSRRNCHLIPLEQGLVINTIKCKVMPQ